MEGAVESPPEDEGVGNEAGQPTVWAVGDLGGLNATPWETDEVSVETDGHQADQEVDDAYGSYDAEQIEADEADQVSVWFHEGGAAWETATDSEAVAQRTAERESRHRRDRFGDALMAETIAIDKNAVWGPIGHCLCTRRSKADLGRCRPD